MGSRIRFYEDESFASCMLNIVSRDDIHSGDLITFRCQENLDILFDADANRCIIRIEFMDDEAHFLKDVVLDRSCYERIATGYLIRLHNIMPRSVYSAKGIDIYFAHEDYTGPVAVGISDMEYYTEEMLNEDE